MAKKHTEDTIRGFAPEEEAEAPVPVEGVDPTAREENARATAQDALLSQYEHTIDPHDPYKRRDLILFEDIDRQLMNASTEQEKDEILLNLLKDYINTHRDFDSVILKYEDQMSMDLKTSMFYDTYYGQPTIFRATEQFEGDFLSFVLKILTETTVKVQDYFLRKCFSRRVNFDVISAMLKVTTIDAESKADIIVGQDWNPELFQFAKSLLDQVSPDLKEKIVEKALRHGYSFTGEAPARTVETSTLLMEDMKRGFSLNEWYEQHQNNPIIAEASKKEVQEVLEQISQEKFQRSLDRLNPDQFGEVLQSVDKVTEILQAKFEKEEEPSAFRLLKFTSNFDAINRCLKALSQQLPGKPKLEDLSPDQFRALIHDEKKIGEWMKEDRFKRFSEEVFQITTKYMSMIDGYYDDFVARDLTDEKNMVVRQMTHQHETYLKIMKNVPEQIQRQAEKLLQNMVRDVEKKFKEIVQRLRKEQIIAKKLFRDDVTDHLRYFEEKIANDVSRTIEDGRGGVSLKPEHLYLPGEIITPGEMIKEDFDSYMSKHTIMERRMISIFGELFGSPQESAENIDDMA